MRFPWPLRFPFSARLYTATPVNHLSVCENCTEGLVVGSQKDWRTLKGRVSPMHLPNNSRAFRDVLPHFVCINDLCGTSIQAINNADDFALWDSNFHHTGLDKYRDYVKRQTPFPNFRRNFSLFTCFQCTFIIFWSNQWRAESLLTALFLGHRKQQHLLVIALSTVIILYRAPSRYPKRRVSDSTLITKSRR